MTLGLCSRFVLYAYYVLGLAPPPLPPSHLLCFMHLYQMLTAQLQTTPTSK